MAKTFTFDVTQTFATLQKVSDFCLKLNPKKKYDIEIKEHKEKRSLNANSYAWVLISKIADMLKTDKDSVYLEMLKSYGQGGIVKIPNKAVKDFKRAFKYCEQHESLPAEENAQYYRFWVGSSTYCTSEMATLIDGIVSEAKDLEIETLTPNELERLKSEWK